jgi:hypothetical protein
MYNFPATPSVGQIYSGYRWDGLKWSPLGLTSQQSGDKQPVWQDGSVAMIGQLKLVTPATSPTDAVAKSFSDGNVSYSVSQSLTLTQQSQARQNISASPWDGAAYGGLQVNGGCEITQERAGNTSYALTIGAWNYIQDCWMAYCTSAPLVAYCYPAYIGGAGFLPPGMPASTLLNITTAKAALAADDQIMIDQRIEGYRIAGLQWGTANAVPITIGFYGYCDQAGTYPGTFTLTIVNAAATRWYRVNITHNTAGQWEWKTATIPGCTDGVWAKDNTLGMYVRFCFGAGTNQQGPVGAWTATGGSGSAQTRNFCAATGSNALTGLVIAAGTTDPIPEARARFMVRPYMHEIQLCRRYFYNGVPPLRGVSTGNTLLQSASCIHPVPMRAVPSVSVATALPCYDTSTGTTTLTSVAANRSTVEILDLNFNMAAALGAQKRIMVYQGGGGNLVVDARL